MPIESDDPVVAVHGDEYDRLVRSEPRTPQRRFGLRGLRNALLIVAGALVIAALVCLFAAPYGAGFFPLVFLGFAVLVGAWNASAWRSVRAGRESQPVVRHRAARNIGLTVLFAAGSAVAVFALMLSAVIFSIAVGPAIPR